MKYLVVFQKVGDNKYSAFVPDLPTCAATGNTLDQTCMRIRDALYISTHALETSPPPTAFTAEIDSDDPSDDVRMLSR